MTTAEQLAPDGISTARREYAAGLSRWAEAIASDPNVPQLSVGGTELLVFAHNRDEFLAMSALIEYRSHEIDHHGNYQLHVHGHIDGLRVVLFAHAEDACERGETRMVEQTDWTFNGHPVRVSP